jgi:hypothetical protein
LLALHATIKKHESEMTYPQESVAIKREFSDVSNEDGPKGGKLLEMFCHLKAKLLGIRVRARMVVKTARGRK